MVSSPLVSTFLLLCLAAIAQTSSLHGSTYHRSLADRLAHPVDPIKKQPRAGKLHRRRNCKAPGTSSSSTAATLATEAVGSSIVAVTADSSTPVTPTSTKAAPAKTTSTATTESTTSKETQAATTSTAASAGSSASTGSSTSSSSGGHEFTLTNKCSSAVRPVVVSTACGYSPRCSDAFAGSLPPPGSLAAGATTTITIPDNFVGRLFAQDGSCGAEGESCTMLEFNLDADSFYTPNSYDISNIQGFTQSISLGAEGCDTVTCTDANCSCENAYPIGDMTGCGDDLPVKACGAGNKAFTVVFCP